MAEQVDETLRQSLELEPVATLIVNREGKILLANGHVERLFGFKHGELSQRPLEELVPQNFRESHPTKRADYVAAPSNRLMSRNTVLGCRKDGTEFPAEISLSPIETEQGLLVSAIIRDVTSRRNVEQTL
jgi:PAS domain S-box-containing protein